MEITAQQRVEQLFKPLHAQFGSPRPDDSIVLSLHNDAGDALYCRVLSPNQINTQLELDSVLEEIRLELAVRSGTIPAELRKTLKEQNSILSYLNN